MNKNKGRNYPEISGKIIIKMKHNHGRKIKFSYKNIVKEADQRLIIFN